MPRAQSIGGGQWGLTWNDIKEAVAEYEVAYRCRIEWNVAVVSYGRDRPVRYLAVVCEAVSGKQGPNRIIGTGTSQLGGNKGAASLPGAFLQSLTIATADLDKRRAEPRYNRDTPLAELPGRQPE